MSNNTTFDVYVANIPQNYEENEIIEIFNIVGEISGVKILPPKVDHKGKVAFVKFTKEENALCASRYMNNHQLENGTTLLVRYRPVAQKGSGDELKLKINDSFRDATNKLPVANEFKVNEMITVVVSHIESPLSFFAQIYDLNEAKNLQELAEKLQSLCPSQPSVAGQLSAEQMYGCKFSEDNLWYRSKIEKCLVNNMVRIRYIDYGNSEIVDRLALVLLPTELAAAPAFAACHHLDGLELVDNTDTSELYLKGMIVVEEMIENQTIDVKIKAIENGKHYCKVFQVHDGALLDLPTKLITTGCAKVKTNENKENAFSVPRKSVSDKTRSPFSVYVNGLLKGQEKPPSPPQLPKLQNDNSQVLKQKIESQKTEIETLKLEQNHAVSSKFKKLLSCVSDLRRKRSVVTGSDIFDEHLIKKIDICLDDESICLEDIDKYQQMLITEKHLQGQLALIGGSKDQKELPALIEKRNELMDKALVDINAFLEHVSSLPLESRLSSINEAIKELKKDYSDILNSDTDQTIKQPLLEVAMKTYAALKTEKFSSVKVLQKNTNDVSQRLFRVLSQLQRECHCVVFETDGLDIDIDSIMALYTSAIKEEIDGITALTTEVNSTSALNDVVLSLMKALEKEVHDITFIRDTQVPLCQKEKKKYEFHQERPNDDKIVNIRNEIKKLKSQFRHKLADVTDLEEDSGDDNIEELKELQEELQDIRFKLHGSFLRELEELKSLTMHLENFPELISMHPELSLNSFKASNCLLQNSRSIEHYTHNEMPLLDAQRNINTYKLVFNEEPCVLKEIILDGKTVEFSDLLMRVVKYLKNSSDYDMKIDCVFTSKNKRKCYLQQPFMDGGNLKDFIQNSKPSNMIINNLLKDVLTALSLKREPYCALKPQNVLIKMTSGGIAKAFLAEPNFLENQEKQFTNCLFLHNVIPGYPVLDMYHEEPSMKADMVCFGGLLLWALHQSADFSKNIHGDVELIVENAELRDILRKLLNPSSSERFDASQALKHPYFVNTVPSIPLPEIVIETEKPTAEVENEDDDVTDDDEVENEEKDAELAQDGWNQALLSRKKRMALKLAVVMNKPEEMSISDDDDF